jgi:ribosomal protein S18 acetylase RimI-like enzyme
VTATYSFLIDTNIVIQLEDDRPVKAEFSDLVRRCTEHAVTLCVHEASETDVGRDRDPGRRSVTISKLLKFQTIRGVFTPPSSVLESRFGSIRNDNDRVDVLLLNALDRNAADFLVTEDLGLHKRARLVNLQERVFRVRDAVDWLIRAYEPKAVRLPYIVERKCFELDRSDPIFATLREGYPEFDAWFAKSARRTCWSLEVNGRIAGLAIRKDNEPRYETDAKLLGDKILKISTFKIKDEFRGEKFGEHLLKQILWFAQRNRYDIVYLTAHADGQEILVDLLEQYGFLRTGIKETTGEAIIEKRIYRPPIRQRGFKPLADDMDTYPCFRDDDAIQVFCIPIRPHWYSVLFPENDPQPMLFDTSPEFTDHRTPGNTIRKVYVCRTPVKKLNAGDVLLFYVSGKGTTSGFVRTVGIVESMTETTNAIDLLRKTGRRSVYSPNEQIEILSAKPTPLKIIDFLLAGHLNEPVSMDSLLHLGALQAAPQSLARLDKMAYGKLEIHKRLGYQ